MTIERLAIPSAAVLSCMLLASCGSGNSNQTQPAGAGGGGGAAQQSPTTPSGGGQGGVLIPPGQPDGAPIMPSGTGVSIEDSPPDDGDDEHEGDGR